MQDKKKPNDSTNEVFDNIKDEKQLKVVHSDGQVELFRPRFIKEQLLRETDISEEIALKIQRRVSEKLRKLEIDEISTSTIRAEVSAQLTSRGLLDEEKQSRKLGMSVKEFEDLVQNGCKDNANIGYSPEMIAKYAYDSIAKSYALQDMPEHCAQAHIDGFVHCLSGNNDLIVKIDNQILVKNIKSIVEDISTNPSLEIFVPSVNPTTLKIDWKKIVDAKKTGHRECYDVEFSKGYKIEVTDDHKFLKYNSRYNKFSKKYDICIKDIKNFNTVRIGSINYIPYICTDNYHKSALFGFFLGDGRLVDKKIIFRLKKEGKIQYLINLLETLNITYSHYVYQDVASITIDNTFYLGDKEKNNIKTNFTINYTGVLEGLINSDGYVTLHGKYKSIYLEYDSANKNITNLFFIACLTHNIRPSFQKIIRKEQNPKWSDIYRCVIQNRYVDDLIMNINLRKEHQARIEGYTPSKSSVHGTTGLTIKNIQSIGKQDVFNITVEDNHNFMAGTQGFVLVQNCHDLEYFNTRPNCMNYDLRFFARNGLKIHGDPEQYDKDGNLVDVVPKMGSVAKPAKSLEVILNHLLQAWMAGASVFSGGQGLVNFNTLLAPYARGRTYKDIKQAIQGFWYNSNMSLIARGGQVLFSSVGVDLSIPDVLKDQPAIGPGGVEVGVYGDYQEEADLIFRAILEVSEEKDGNGAYFRFPNTVFNIREGDLDEYTGTCQLLHEKGANNPTLYYVNCTEMERTVMGCFSPDTSLWVKIDNQLHYLSFKEIDELLNANIGKTKIDNIEVLTVDDNRNIIWHKAKSFIKNEPQELYKIKLTGNKSFVCDKNHSMITYQGMNRKNILDCKNNLLDVACILNNEQSCLTPDKQAMLYGFYLGADFNTGHANFMLLKEDKINYVRNLLDDLDIKYREEIVYHSRDDANYTVFYFNSNEIQKPDLTNINCLAGLLSGLLSSDGYVRINGVLNKSLTVEFVSTNMECTQLFKWACFNLGIKFSSRVIQPSKNQKNRQPFERVYLSCNYESVRILQQLILRDEQHQIIQSVDNNYRHITETKGQSVKEIIPLNESDYTYCFEVNDRIIVGDDFILTGNCRTALPMNYAFDYEKDCCNTGNFMYSTLNLPLIALEANGDRQEFYNLLNDMCDIVYDTLIYRRECVIDVIYNKHMSDFLLQKDKDTGEPLWDIDRTTMTIGYCGLHECLQILKDEDGEAILNFINAKKDEFHKKDGLRWSVIGSPAESASHRFAEIIKEKYPDAPVQGVKGRYYLTNSSHIPVSADTTIIDHIKNADKYHPLSWGGNILHIWSGEVWSDPKAIWKLNKKILETGTIFWAYSKVFTYCPECGYTINDNLDVCPICGSTHVFVYDRITGYYVYVESYNEGKQQEFIDRKRQQININILET